MAKTLIVIDPMGFNLVSLGLQYVLLKGTLVELGDTVYRLPYVNFSGIDNINAGVELLDDKLNSTTGDILVFAYSEGAQVATKWLREYGTESPITPTSRLKFLLIGNAERRYGGFAYKHSTFDAVADTEGLPEPLEDGTSTVHYQVTDFARQYDGVADFPDAPIIQDAIESVGGVTTDPFNWILRALQDVTNALIGNYKDAALNAVLGMNLIHNNYFLVTPDDPHNVRFTDPDHPSVEYVWSPTYPAPMLGGGTTFPSLDRDQRARIETAYARPVTLPSPNYAQISLFTTDFFATDDDFRRLDETGWFPQAPVVGSVVVRPSAARIVVTGGSPSVDVSADRLVSPSAARVVVSGGTATVRTTKTVKPSGGKLVVSGGVPDVTVAMRLTPGSVRVKVRGGTPTVTLTDNKVVRPAGAVLKLKWFAPIVLAPRVVVPQPAVLTIAGGQPSVVVGAAPLVAYPSESLFPSETLFPTSGD